MQVPSRGAWTVAPFALALVALSPFAHSPRLAAAEWRLETKEFPAGWSAAAPREELAPHFEHVPAGGPKQAGAWRIRSDRDQPGHGWWRKSFPVVGGRCYAFRALRRTTDVESARRSALARVAWRNAQAGPVLADVPPEATGQPAVTAEPEYPLDRATDAAGWTEVTGVWRAPLQATQAVVELHLLWAPGGAIDWSEVALTETAAPPARKVRLAAAHFMPRGGKSSQDNCEQYAPLIAEAGRGKVDLLVLGETLTYVGLGKSMADVAEPVPGPSTEYFGKLAREQRLHLVVGLVERDGRLIYNVAVLIGPDGKLVGKYRKVCLPRSEVEAGVTPGRDYPVFDTSLGKIGMMVCYDGFFPEVARELGNRGAEIVAWPVWGCNPKLAAARACENHLHLVSSTYTDVSRNWTRTAIYNHAGEPLAQGETWGTIVTTDVDLSRRHYWPNNLGDFRAEIIRERP